jgi:hypothetical protein
MLLYKISTIKSLQPVLKLYSIYGSPEIAPGLLKGMAWIFRAFSRIPFRPVIKIYRFDNEAICGEPGSRYLSEV